MNTDVIGLIGGLAIPFLAISLPIIIVAIVTYSLHVQDQQRHETISRLIEKGLPVPPELLGSQRRHLFAAKGSPSSFLRTAFTLIGLGIGLIIFFLTRGGDNWGIGAIPLAIGLAQLVAWKLERPKPGDLDSNAKDL